ncbi:PadR family transcriptional regulator [Heyndrickxia sporothermodurans]|nr:PadR family transcriptional regulator [Heyndrickxia sporothermodurans]
MDNRLEKLQKSMEGTIFNKLNFQEEHQKNVRERIQKLKESEKDIFLAVLQLLVQEKAGFELINLLRSRGFQKFDDNEGELYILLHRLEQKGYLKSRWEKTDIKYYQLYHKGIRILNRLEKSQTKGLLALREILEG